MAGLYTRKNLGEKKLNLSDALQKLYAPGIDEDIRLFAFSNALYSEIKSGSIEIDSDTEEEFLAINQISGFINQPFKNQAGQTVLRTKFVTNNFTFSSENKVFFEAISPLLNMDRRSNLDPGAPIVKIENGGIVNISVIGAGSKYEIRNSNGQKQIIPNGQEAEVLVSLRGKTSGSENCNVKVFVTSDGSISTLTTPVVIDSGSGYIEGEALEIIRQCDVNRYGEEETEARHKCKKYSSSQSAIYHKLYDETDQSTGVNAYLVSDKYYYTTKDCGDNGFFLFDERENKWVYLGNFYDSLAEIPTPVQSPLLKIRRFDKLTSNNLLKLRSLDSESYQMSYHEAFSVGQDELGSTIRDLSNRVEDIRDQFKYFLQNNKNHRSEVDPNNSLKIKYNSFEGRTIDSNFRIVFRDSDNVLDNYPEVTFDRLQLLQQTGSGDNSEVVIGGVVKYRAPGLFMNVGGVYIRAFSTDDKPFLGKNGRYFISPRLHQPTNLENFAGSYEEVSDTAGSYKYSLSASHLPSSSTPTPYGFSTEISILSQNLSFESKDGGFVFHRQLTTPTIYNTSGVIGLPLLDYRTDRNSNQFYSPNILAILDPN